MTSNWIERGKDVLLIEIEALEQVRHLLGSSFALAVEMLVSCKGRVAITGIGKSGLVGRKIAATLSSTGTPAYFLHPVEGAHGDLGAVRENDVIIAISHSGKTDELNAILPALRSLGAKIIAITAGLHSPLAGLSDLVINASVPREACPMNLAPTSSTTAALALGDALAVCLIEAKAFTANDFRRFHPGGALGSRLSLCVGDIMHRDKLPLAPDSSSLAGALEVLDRGGFGSVLLSTPQMGLAGILTDGDVRRLLHQGKYYPDAPVRQFMTKNPRVARERMSVAELMDIMEEKAITVLPVLGPGQSGEGTDGPIVGIVHLHDLLGKGQVKFANPNDAGGAGGANGADGGNRPGKPAVAGKDA
ncbi:KpsF/GutQ family sugar-phosphate isomerase [Desulfovibrio sp. OttesenSCG-928-A18]|nr:KpsF/GutQ family sugar-phosphate isomerase [Desulfovibrio sp. OttesenSCG-928-A18]